METLFAVLAFFAFFVFMIRYTLKKKKELVASGFNNENRMINVRYSCGHPDIDKPGMYNIGINNNSIYFLTVFGDKTKTTIPVSWIKNITVEDESTFSKRVTLTRMALIGVFAFAAKKKVKHELAYLTIQWNDSRFDHDTVFEFEGTGSIEEANKLRNMMLRGLRQ